MGYVIQIHDPDGMEITLTAPGKYNPDILEDVKRRLMDAYKEASQEHLAKVLALVAAGVSPIPEDEDEE